jgi:hypothetical protein
VIKTASYFLEHHHHRSRLGVREGLLGLFHGAAGAEARVCDDDFPLGRSGTGWRSYSKVTDVRLRDSRRHDQDRNRSPRSTDDGPCSHGRDALGGWYGSPLGPRNVSGGGPLYSSPAPG